jgi:diadenosine tetraphosphate (Ap4A) HIT family hydrolase
VVSNYHLLWAPWAHVTQEWDVPSAWITELYKLLEEVPGFGSDRTKWPAIRIVILTGAQAGRTQPHWHVHVEIALVGGITKTYENFVTPV